MKSSRSPSRSGSIVSSIASNSASSAWVWPAASAVKCIANRSISVTAHPFGKVEQQAYAGAHPVAANRSITMHRQRFADPLDPSSTNPVTARELIHIAQRDHAYAVERRDRAQVQRTVCRFRHGHLRRLEKLAEARSRDALIEAYA